MILDQRSSHYAISGVRKPAIESLDVYPRYELLSSPALPSGVPHLITEDGDRFANVTHVFLTAALLWR